MGYLAHIAFCVFLIVFVKAFYDGGDIDSYHYHGSVVANLLYEDFFRNAPDVIRVIFNISAEHNVIRGMGGPTGALVGISAILQYLMGGDALYGSSMVISILAFWGQYFIYLTLKSELSESLKERILVATLLIPSVVFWSSGLVKEGVALAGLGPLVWGVITIVRGRGWVKGIIAASYGAILIGIIKPYFLAPFFIAFGAYLYWKRAIAKRQADAVVIKPIYLILATLIVLLGLVVIGRIFPSISMSRIAETTAAQQQLVTKTTGGSDYEIASEGERSLIGQMYLAPIGLAFALFRPLPFEIRNIAMALNVIEMTIILIFWIQIIRARRIARTRDIITGNPILVFCLVFTVVAGIGVGLATTNMGSLSRYRMPIMPFYAALLLVLQKKK